MHVGLCDIFYDDRDIKVPSADSLVIGCCHESSVLVDEGNGIDRT
jgi:hypothetical protein